MRANNYYRAAEFFLHGDPADPRINHAYHRATQCFHAAAALFTPAIEVVEIPYEDTVLHGYFYCAAGSEGDDTARPTMVLHNGFDGSAEEMHYNGAAAGIERGYHVLTFDGPGQPAARHLEGLVFRPDWENVVTPVLDWVMARPGVDRARVGLLGLSMGGLLAPRAAAFDHRLAACVAVDGVYDLAASVLRAVPGSRPDAEAALRADSAPKPTPRSKISWPVTRRSVGPSPTGCTSWARTHLAPSPLLPGLHPRQRRRRTDHLPDPGVRRRARHLLRRPAPGTVRPPDLPQDPAAFHQRRGRRRPLPNRRSAPGLRPDLRLARRHAGDQPLTGAANRAWLTAGVGDRAFSAAVAWPPHQCLKCKKRLPARQRTPRYIATNRSRDGRGRVSEQCNTSSWSTTVVRAASCDAAPSPALLAPCKLASPPKGSSTGSQTSR
jgi:hypothetical protein